MGSAVCGFNMTSVNASFDGAFKYQSSSNSAWGAVFDTKTSFQCETGDESDRLVAADKYQLMDSPVQPISPQPLYTVDYHK